MVARKKVVVQPAKGGPGWDVVTSTGKKHFDTKQPAVDAGRQTAKGSADPSQLVIKKADGRIQTEHTYQNDPRRHKG